MAFERIEDASIPLIVMATDALTGAEVILDSGPAVPALLASAALPGVYPPVEVGGQLLIDGGVANNTPITTAIEAGASEVWVLSTGYSCGLVKVPTNPLALALHGVALLVQQRLLLEARTRTYLVPVHFIPPPCPISITPASRYPLGLPEIRCSNHHLAGNTAPVGALAADELPSTGAIAARCNGSATTALRRPLTMTSLDAHWLSYGSA